MAEPGFNISIFGPDGPAPQNSAELFGHEAEDAFRARGAGDPQPFIIAAKSDDAWIGGVFMLVEREGDDAVASIRQVVIKPASRGRGVAGWLLRRAHSLAEERGCTRIRSTAGWGCPDHLAMYDRLGYERARGQPPYLVAKSL